MCSGPAHEHVDEPSYFNLGGQTQPSIDDEVFTVNNYLEIDQEHADLTEWLRCHDALEPHDADMRAWMIMLQNSV